MGIVYALVMLSVVLVGFAIWAFFWAVQNNQFDDLDTPAFAILEDDDPLEPGSSSAVRKQDESVANEMVNEATDGAGSTPQKPGTVVDKPAAGRKA